MFSGGDGVKNMSMGKQFVFNSKEFLSGGVWISPSGDIFGIPLTHIRSVISNPGQFGFTKEQLKEIFNRHNEGVGSEGNARDEVIALLVSNGWVRIRYYSGDFGFHVELGKFSNTCKEYLQEWASGVLNKNPDRADYPVKVCEVLNGNLETTFKLKDLLDSKDFVMIAKTCSDT